MSVFVTQGPRTFFVCETSIGLDLILGPWWVVVDALEPFTVGPQQTRKVKGERLSLEDPLSLTKTVVPCTVLSKI